MHVGCSLRCNARKQLSWSSHHTAPSQLTAKLFPACNGLWECNEQPAGETDETTQQVSCAHPMKSARPGGPYTCIGMSDASRPISRAELVVHSMPAARTSDRGA